MIWLTADTHFCHDKLWKEGYRLEGFENLILRYADTFLAPNDVLLHLGDVCLYPRGTSLAKDWLAHMGRRGIKKWLVRGNHDHKSAEKYLEEGWDWCGDAMELDYMGKDLVFTHRPLPTVEVAVSGFNIHGHLHSGEHRGEVAEDGRHILVSQELLEYHPVSLKALVRLGVTPCFKDGRFVKRERSKAPAGADQLTGSRPSDILTDSQ